MTKSNGQNNKATTTEKKDQNVTTTDAQATEATTTEEINMTESTEAVEATTTTEATEAEVVIQAIKAFVAHEGTAAAIGTAMAKAHVSRRASVQTEALMATMATMTPEQMATVLEAMANLPKAISRVNKRTATEEEARWIKTLLRSAIKVGGEAILAEQNEVTDDEGNVVLDEATGESTLIDLFGGDEFLAGLFCEAGEKLLAMTDKVNVLSGTKASFSVKPQDVVTFDDEGKAVLTGTYKEQDHEAVLTADGKVRIDGQEFGNLSGAAGHVVGRSQNGWTFWKFEGTLLSELR